MPDNSFYSIKKISVVIIIALIAIIAGSVIYYKGLYNKQLNYNTRMLDRQVKIAGRSVDSTDHGFTADLHELIRSGNDEHFISDPVQLAVTVDKIKMFFSRYEDLVTGIRIYDNSKNEYTLKKDETGNNWLEQLFVLHVQGEMVPGETLVWQDRSYEYFVPVVADKVLAGNIVVSIDYQNYFKKLFSSFNLEDFQWQWVIDDSNEIIFSNSKKDFKYTNQQKIAQQWAIGGTGNMIHSAGGNGEAGKEIISSFYSSSLLQKRFSIVFSSPAGETGRYIIRNSFFMGFAIILIFLLVALLFIKIIKAQKKELAWNSESVQLLSGIIDEMPVGIIIHDRNRKIVKANNKAAEQYSFGSAGKMEGTVFPEPEITDEDNYFSRHLGSSFNPEQFVILKKDSSDMILYRTTIPVNYPVKDLIMEILVDVTKLESARKQEATASSAKTEFLARMSYELRTPLNGIIGMTDILEKQELSSESEAILKLIRRSSEVLLNIINDILDFSKAESGKIILEEIPFSLREEIVYCYDLARTNTDVTQVEITCDVETNIPDRVIGDPYRIRQILTNFFNFSIANTRKGRIVLKCIQKENEEGRIKLAFNLADTGKKYDGPTLKRMFGNHAGLASKAGHNDESGFSLIVARQMITLMGGDFDVVSPSGLDGESGTRIEFTINIWSNEKPVKYLKNDSVSSFCQIRTLVITGDNRDEEILGTIHKLGLPMTVTTFQKSTIGQIKASLNIPDKKYNLLIILDDRDFDGLAAANEIHKNSLSDQFIILMISSKDVRGNLVKCYTSGIDHYIVKPYDIKELYETVRSSFPITEKSLPSNETEKVRKDLKILVVEDNKMNQKVIGTMLKSLGYSFDFADDGFAGLIQAKTRRYDVIFMDLIMPQMDGFESARRILEYDDKLLIVAFTADNMPDSKRKAELSGIREFISKPVRIEDLRKFFARYFISN